MSHSIGDLLHLELADNPKVNFTSYVFLSASCANYMIYSNLAKLTILQSV